MERCAVKGRFQLAPEAKELDALFVARVREALLVPGSALKF